MDDEAPNVWRVAAPTPMASSQAVGAADADVCRSPIS